MTRCPIGFTHDFHVEAMDRDAWDRDMDLLQDMGATALRAGISPWTSSNEQLSHMEWCLQDAKSRGLDIMLVTAQLANSQDPEVPLEQKYTQALEYIEEIAPRLAPHVKWWQVLNEHDAASWGEYESLGSSWDDNTGGQRRPGMTDEYLETVEYIMSHSKDLIKAVNPNVLVGTAITGVNVDTANEIYIWRPFHRIVRSVDFIGINAYPIVWDKNYYELPARMRRTSHWASRLYGREVPVIITEIGLPSIGQPEDETMEWIAHQIDYGTRSDDVTGLFIYQLVDAGTDQNDAEHQFGIFRPDKTPKDGYRSVRAMIRSINGVI